MFLERDVSSRTTDNSGSSSLTVGAECGSSIFGQISTIAPSLMMWIDVLVLAATALARAAARIIAWSAWSIQLLALMVD